ncbi:signal transduction histidine kinase [Kibdelosporangium banguiense]|uniref:histidine kinase n=1 Tax=Kibdelosporangium banguiense TaxID=1365924 RepID=A0ABS4U4C8_9PSEU|nr:histidine kinase [Kibdelosporangium banguiense]MBP2331059.1 signal transduction histidine kinase [Kibdelosporangium banguiense]
MLTTKLSLKRQSWLVAAVCMVADGAAVVLYGCVTWQNWLVLFVTLAVDAALAGPARLSGVVAVAHAAVPVGMALLTGWRSPANDAGILIAGYRAGAWLQGVPAVASLAVLAAGLMIGHAMTGRHLLYCVVGAVQSAVLPWLVGRYTTARRSYLAELEKRSEMERRDAEDAVTKAISAERSSIARDLHDVIVHHVSAIGLHAGAARLGLPAGNATLEGSLRSVETASRAAMVDLRHLLDLLHGDNSEGARQPGLDNLDELFEGVRAAGIPARMEVSGARGEVPESLGITVYRIVQEMLTNALRHGDSSGVTVTLEYGPSSLTVSSENNIGVGRDQPGAVRRGLVGIRNRAAMFSGRTRYGLEPDGSWRTVVTFPLEGQ